ncbi:MAG: FmdB family zinc ribbon protein [Aquabacterium sp.]|jgi:putative FmdB family regulatory protein|uniref:FmdB family zinc ribbon protein n=1 Tax=Aquabacterium sp. TaxID=1872578 RepID=UPI003BAEAEA3
MPIYAYRCETCGHAKDVLQKMSDPVLTTCPSCGAESFKKQLTAAGFQLKGSGWYVTDFRGGSGGGAAAASGAAAAAPEADTATPSSGGDAPSASSASSSSSSSDSGGSSGAAGCAGSCACH